MSNPVIWSNVTQHPELFADTTAYVGGNRPRGTAAPASGPAGALKTDAEKLERKMAEFNEKWRDGTLLKNAVNLADLFSGLDIGSKSAASNDFNAKMEQVNSLIQGYCSKYGLQPF